MADNYGPSITALKLYERTSAKGNVYLSGRWGGLRVAVMKSKDVSDSGDAIWTMRLSEVTQQQREAAGAERATKLGLESEPGSAKRDYQRPPAERRTGLAVEGVDDEIPF